MTSNINHKSGLWNGSALVLSALQVRLLKYITIHQAVKIVIFSLLVLVGRMLKLKRNLAIGKEYRF